MADPGDPVPESSVCSSIKTHANVPQGINIGSGYTTPTPPVVRMIIRVPLIHPFVNAVDFGIWVNAERSQVLAFNVDQWIIS